MKTVFWLVWAGVLATAVLGTAATLGYAPSAVALAEQTPQGLAGRVTLTPPPATISISSPSVTPERDCTQVFPLENVEAVELGRTTLLQLEAALGRARRDPGRASYYRFTAQGCVLRALIGVEEVLEIEVRDYGTLGLLLERYGIPAAVGVSQGNLTLLEVGYTVLLYPDRGVIAVLPVEPTALTPDTPLYRLIFRPPFGAAAQLRRLNARAVAWPLPTGTPTPDAEHES